MRCRVFKSNNRELHFKDAFRIAIGAVRTSNGARSGIQKIDLGIQVVHLGIQVVRPVRNSIGAFRNSIGAFSYSSGAPNYVFKTRI